MHSANQAVGAAKPLPLTWFDGSILGKPSNSCGTMEATVPDLLIDKHGRTTILTINRPDRMNALGGTVMADLTEAIREFNSDGTQRVAIITGAGERAFSAGADLKELASKNSSDGGGQLPMSRFPDIGG